MKLKPTILEIVLDNPLCTEDDIKTALKQMDFKPRNELLVDVSIADLLWDGALYKTATGGIIVSRSRKR